MCEPGEPRSDAILLNDNDLTCSRYVVIQVVHLGRLSPSGLPSYRKQLKVEGVEVYLSHCWQNCFCFLITRLTSQMFKIPHNPNHYSLQTDLHFQKLQL